MKHKFKKKLHLTIGTFFDVVFASSKIFYRESK